MNSEYKSLFLNEELPSEETRRAFIEALRKASLSLQMRPEDTINIAYSIAGLMATPYAQSLDSSDPIDKILTIAGELEINPSNSDELRLELIDEINKIQ